jgi:extracellular factor (EF) 3-hydroxypalmitic acid methyl ester biosynthesis protein
MSDQPAVADDLQLARDHFAKMRVMVEAGGPTQEQYPEVHRWLRETEGLLTRMGLTRDYLFGFWRDLGADFLNDTMQGLALRKPHGYAGDFEIIDRIYTQHISSNPTHAR